MEIDQVATHDAWKAAKTQCRETGEVLTMTAPNPLVKKWEWKEVYPVFEEENEEIDGNFDDE